MLRFRFAALLTVPAIALVLSACAAGTPGVIGDDTPTSVPAIAAVSDDEPSNTTVLDLSTAPPEPTETATARPTRTPEPTEEPTEQPRPTRTPTPGPTSRPEPPEDDGSGLSLVFDRGISGRAEIALTFDAGADRGFAEQILDTLADYGVKASFGITGHWADENPDLVERMAAEGHMIFNHTWTHRSFTGFSTSDWDEGVLSTEERVEEVESTERVIARVTGGYETAPYFRPPYGDLDDGVLADIASAGYWVTVMWSCDSLGWNGASVDQIIERCGTTAEPGDIILMHVGAESLDAEALPGLIELYLDQGFELVTVEDLLQP